jgi:lipopolysaccharide/colanic/teichoic acid biosynthesis glycosyltransferase
MIQAAKRIAVITNNNMLAHQVRVAMQDLFDVDCYKNGFELHHSMEKPIAYKAIISDDELLGANGVTLHKVLVGCGYGNIPFILILNQLNNEQRKLAMQENIAEIFSKPLNQNALRVRVPYLVENYTNVNFDQDKTPGYKLPVFKRIFDIIFSGLALLFLSPFFLLIAILIRSESKGPIFYYSLRVGSGYNVFKFYKFRSMYSGADARLKDLSHLNQYNTAKAVAVSSNITINELCELCEQAGTGCINPLYADNKVVCETLYNQRKDSNTDSAFIKIKDDPRVTRVGNFIRNVSIDELPQLWNVFIGDMSIVGNRPLPLYEAEKITTDKYSLRFQAPAGMTGLWQVEKRGRGEMSEAERLSLDNNYAQTHSLRNDIRLICRTIPALFQTENV